MILQCFAPQVIPNIFVLATILFKFEDTNFASRAFSLSFPTVRVKPGSKINDLIVAVDNCRKKSQRLHESFFESYKVHRDNHFRCLSLKK
jgi:hypothetical protein